MMSSDYTCGLCLKEFKQKIDYTRHKNKKNACVTADKLQQVVEKKVEEKMSHDTTVKNMSTLFSACMNILRDNEFLTGEKALRNLSYLLVLRLIEPMIGSEIELESMEYPFPDAYRPKKEKFLKYTKFSNIAASKEDDIPTILKLIWEFILSNHPKTKDIFLTGKGFDMKKQATFRKLIDKLSEFDFSSVNVDIQGHAYEDLLKDIMTGKVLGQFFTQPLVKDMMVELINPQLLHDGTCETIFDPAMGTGGFLMTSLRHLQKQSKDKNINIKWEFITSHGVGGRESEPSTFQLAKTNMLVSCGHMFNTLQEGDSIRDPIKDKYDIVLANPPFGIKGLDYKEIRNEDGVRDKYLPIESKSAVPLFLQAIISILKVGGRCAMVMPDGQELFGKGKALVALREYLMKSCDLREVIYLPSGVFSNTSIKTCVLYFHKRKECSEVVKIGDKKVRTYTFKTHLQTESVKFYDYNPYEKVKNLLVEVSGERISQNNYSLNYAEYLESEDHEENKEYNSEVEWKTLGEVCEIRNGKRIVKAQSESGEYPVYGGGDITSFYTNIYNREDINCKISREGMSEHNCVLLIKGKFYLNSQGLTINSNSTYLLDKYLWYYLLENKSLIFQCGRGTAQKAIDMDQFKSLKIPIPSLHTQQRIVERLDYLYETCIETSTNAIEQLKTKKGMIVEMMTTGVTSKPLGEVCEMKTKGNINSKDISNTGEFPFYKASVTNPNGTHKDYCFDGEEYILFVKSGGNSKTPLSLTHGIGKVYFCSGKTCGNSEVVCIKSTNINLKYLFCFLQYSQLDIQKLAKYSTNLGHVDMKKFSEFQIPIPSLQIQKRIVEQCERIDKLITDLEADRDASKQLAASYLKSCIEPPAEQEQEYTDIIISEEDYSDTETKPDIIISEEDYSESDQAI